MVRAKNRSANPASAYGLEGGRLEELDQVGLDADLSVGRSGGEGGAARLLAVGESVGPVDPLLNEFRKRGRAATRADTLEGAEALKRAGLLRDGMSTEQAADIIYAIASSESVYLRLVEHRGWTDEAYATVIEHALAGALSR